jgi:hypothetical protein
MTVLQKMQKYIVPNKKIDTDIYKLTNPDFLFSTLILNSMKRNRRTMLFRVLYTINLGTENNTNVQYFLTVVKTLRTDNNNFGCCASLCH